MLAQTVSRSTVAPHDPKPFLEVRGVSKRFGPTLALDAVSLKFFPGRIHCVLGENGAGKSTLGKIIGGVHSKDAGQILVDGEEVRLGTVARAQQLGISVVFQELSLVPDLSVRANLLLGTEPRSHPFALLRSRAEQIAVRAALARLDIHVDPECLVRDLSIDTRQLLEVAKAIIRGPRMIVLDEPTAMLNETEKLRLYAVLGRLRKDGTTLALITHHLDDVEAVADQASIMRDGRLVKTIEISDSRNHQLLAETLNGAPRPPRPRIGQSARKDVQGFLRFEGLKSTPGMTSALTINRGEIASFYGVVGSGAERISRVCFGLLRAPQLRLYVDGQRTHVRTPVHARRLGFAYLAAGRANGVLATRSIMENLNLPVLRSYAHAGVINRTREIAASELKLKASAVKYACADDNMLTLSGGNQQKVLVARVLSAATNLLILEDPTAGVDVSARHEIWDALRARAASGLTVILISSDLQESIELSDTLYSMYDGALVARYESPQEDDSDAIVADVIGHTSSAGARSLSLEAADSIEMSPTASQ